MVILHLGQQLPDMQGKVQSPPADQGHTEEETATNVGKTWDRDSQCPSETGLSIT